MSSAAYLYASDDPETFTNHGRLFVAALAKDGSTCRLLFDHVNGTGASARLIVAVTNLEPHNGAISIVGCNGTPNPSGMVVGHQVGLAFLQQHASSVSAQSKPVATGQSCVLYSGVLAPGECVAGLWDVQGDGANYEVRALAAAPNDTMDAWAAAKMLDRSTHQRRGVFVIGDAEAPQTLLYPGGLTTVELGANDALLTRASGLDPEVGASYVGEYGIIKHFSLQATQTAWLYECERGTSPATATYQVDGTFIASHQMAPDASFKVLPLQAGVAPLTLVTMSEINSEYPVRLTIGPDDESAAPGDLKNPIYDV